MEQTIRELKFSLSYRLAQNLGCPCGDNVCPSQIQPSEITPC